MVNYKTDYKVGDKVRILNVDGIEGGDEFWDTDDITEVEGFLSSGGMKLKSVKRIGDVVGNFLRSFELQYIELVNDSAYELTDFLSGLVDKIKSLEKRVDELENKPNGNKVCNTNIRFAIEDKLDSKDFVSKIIETLNKYNKKEKLSNNEMRKRIIQEAKEFVKVNEPLCESYKVTSKGVKKVNVKTVKYEVDNKNRKVVCNRIYTNAWGNIGSSAKCLNSDVFNVHIGKAIALGRLLGLDVSKFENAVQPAKVVDGMEVSVNYTDKTRIIKRIETNGKVWFTNNNHDRVGNIESIISDSNAKY